MYVHLKMLGFILSAMAGKNEDLCDNDILSYDSSSTDEEKLYNYVKQNINIVGIATTIENSSDETSTGKTDDDFPIAKRNIKIFENDCTSQTSSNCDSTDSNTSPRETIRKPGKLPDRAILQRISELVEYYLSDENLVNDMFLLKHVTRHKEGYVSLKLLANYKKLKRVRKDWTVLIEALKDSSKLEINCDGTKVRRRNKLSCELEEYTRVFRSVIGYAIPEENISMGKLAEIFSKFGEIESIQLHKSGSISFPELHLVEKVQPGTIQTNCCLVIYEKVHSARLALNHLSSNSNSIMKVMAITRRKIVSDNKIEYVSTREYEGAYFSASDHEDPGSSPYLLGSQNHHKITLASSAVSNNWRDRCDSADLSSTSRRPRQSSKWKTSSVSSNEERCASRLGTLSNSGSTGHVWFRHPSPPKSLPLPRKFLSGSWATIPDSPVSTRRFPLNMEVVSTPNSPWLRRKIVSRSDFTNGLDNCVSTPREACLPDNVIRMPKGPDNTKGFKVNAA